MSKPSLACPARGALVVVGALLVPLLASSAARAQSGSTLTPDRHSYVVNKDVGGERWTINLNLASLDPQRPINVTGNVYQSGRAPSFVWCQVRDDSTGSLDDPGSTFRLRCSGSTACDDTATGCARSRWSTIADLIEIPASFFLPPGGNGLARAGEGVRASSAAAAASAATAATRVDSTGTSLTLPAPVAQLTDRGANLPPDGSSFLVNKDLGGLRWSISLNQIPAQRGNVPVADCGDTLDCVVSSRFLNVTGNVYPSDGSPPQFVWCQERQDSTGDLANPQSEFRFGCVGASACTRSASECAANDWQAIPGGADVRLQASFFLPPGGLPATPQSDPEIVVIGRTSDPPSVMVSLGQGASASVATGQGGCPIGASCTAGAGSCAGIAGRVVDDAAVGCACLVTSVPPECILCGGGASGQCGGDCQYQIGGATARGQCLPFSSSSADCACYAANRDDDVAISICGGTLGSECPTGKCCADDVRDGCDPARGDVDCAGICVDSNGCDPTVSSCGLCLDQRAPEPLICGAIEAPPGASCCEDCPDGSQSCFCQPGRSCNLEADGGGCCPTSRPDLCNGTLCIPSGADCCADCPDGSNQCFCAAGSVCALESEGGGCCPLEAPIRVPEGCCPLDKPVGCGSLCLVEGFECCPDRATPCGPGTLCTADSQCVPSGDDDCGNGFFCEAGFQCVDEDPGCCRTDLTCGPTCLTDGEDCCGADGSFCDAGSVCVGEGPTLSCCPEDLPVLCGDACFPPGTACDSAAGESAVSRAAARLDGGALQTPWNAAASASGGMRARVSEASSAAAASPARP
jgi:hypothetical protein